MGLRRPISSLVLRGTETIDEMGETKCQGRRTGLSNEEHHVGRQHESSRLILKSGSLITPLEEGSKDPQLALVETSVVLLIKLSVGVVSDQVLLKHLQRHLTRPIEDGVKDIVGLITSSHCFISHPVVNVEEVVSVLPGILHHLLGEGADSPVGELILLVGIDPEEMRR